LSCHSSTNTEGRALFVVERSAPAAAMEIPVSLGSLRALPNLLDDPDRIPDKPTVPVLVALLRSTDEQERDEALATLAEMVDGAFGDDGTQLGQEMRANGGIALLSWLLADPSPEVQQMSLMILGNLCSDSVDTNSSATKQTLLHSGGARAILSCVHTEDPAVLLFACGALQNLCYEREWSELAVSHDVHLRLEALLHHEDAMIVRYASGALQNITRSLQLADPEDVLSPHAMAAVKERALEHRLEEFVQRRALSRLEKALAGIPTHLRQQRHENGRRRRVRAAQFDRNDPAASRSSSRPSSAASSRSTGSYVSARSSMTASSMTSGSHASGSHASASHAPPPALVGSPLVGRPSECSPSVSANAQWPPPPVSPSLLTHF
jgi:hypothetical protein